MGRRPPPRTTAGGAPLGYKLAAGLGVASHARAVELSLPFENAAGRSLGADAEPGDHAIGTAGASRRHDSQQSWPRRPSVSCRPFPVGAPAGGVSSLLPRVAQRVVTQQPFGLRGSGPYGFQETSQRRGIESDKTKVGSSRSTGNLRSLNDETRRRSQPSSKRLGGPLGAVLDEFDSHTPLLFS